MDKFGLFVSVSGVALAWASPALALQDAQPASVPQTSAPAATSGGVADIVVTAQRRAENVQKSSLSIQVLTGSQLASVARPQDLNLVATGVQIATGGLNQQVYIRGIGDNSTTSTVQSSVTFNIDGVVLPRSSAASVQFFDIARVEVLKGPQGTLYGRNASGGVINIITNAPKLDVTSASIGMEAGNYKLVDADAAVNLPIGHQAAVRVAGQVVHRDGYTSDGGQDQITQAIRGKLLWQPSDIFHITFSGDFEHIGGQGSGVVVLPVLDGNPWRSNTAAPLAYNFTFGPGTAPYTKPNDRAADARIWGASAEANVDLGFATLTLLPSYRGQKQHYVSYTTNQRFGEGLDGDTKALEGRLGNNSARLKWVVGGFYYHDKAFTQTDNQNGGVNNSILATQVRESLSAFGQATYSLFQPFRIIGGIRYTDESLAGEHQYGFGAYPLVPFTAASAVYDDAKRHFRKVTWKAGAELDLSPSNMLYGTVSTGTKAGGFDPVGTAARSDTSTYKPEMVTSYVLGSKNRFFGGRLQVNVEGFYLDYKNQQLSALAPDEFGGVSFFTRNVGKARIKGASAETTLRPTQADTVELDVEYAHGRNKAYKFTQITAGAYSASNHSLCSATPAGGIVYQINCSGTPVIRLPKWSGTFRYGHEFTLSGGATIRPAVTVAAASKRWLETTYGFNGLAPSYVTADAEIAFTPDSKKFTITGWVKNISNEAVYTGGQSVSNLAPNGARFYTATINPPRTYGVRARFNF